MTSPQRQYDEGIHYEDGLQPVTIGEGIQVVHGLPSPAQTSLDPSRYTPSEPKAYYPVSEGNSYYAPHLAAVKPIRICGLRRQTFWTIFVIAVIVVAAAVGGGVGGGLSARNKQSDSQSAVTVTVLGVSASSMSMGPGSTSTTQSSTSAPSTSLTTASSAATGTAKAGYCSKAVPNWIRQGTIAAGIGRDGFGVRFADLNGDGRVEYLYVETDGAVTAYLNLGSPDPNPLNAGQVDWLDQGVIATGVGGLRNQIQFADLNGDGKAEYLWVHDNGSVDAWLNLGGPDDGADAAKVSWLGQGTIAAGIGKDGANVVFADINGDGLADYLWLDPTTGDVTCYLNTGPLNKGSATDAGKVGWVSKGIIATGFTSRGDLSSARFADMNGDGRMDYCVLSFVNGNVTAWYNNPGTNGSIIWTPVGEIAKGVGDDGRTVQFGDLNGDGRWEYLDVNSTSGAVNAWLNGC